MTQKVKTYKNYK